MTQGRDQQGGQTVDLSPKDSHRGVATNLRCESIGNSMQCFRDIPLPTSYPVQTGRESPVTFS